MNLKDLKIVPPEGMEYYIENGEVRFRKKLSLDEVYKQLFLNKTIYYMDDSGWVCEREDDLDAMIPYDNRTIANNCTSKKQAEKLLAINKLMNVAKYLNGDWKPDWDECKEYIWSICLDGDYIDVVYSFKCNSELVYFKTKELARQAIEILGEETIKLALSTDW